MLIGVAAHADCPIRQIAEYTASIFPGNGRLPPAAYRVAQFRALEGIGFRLLDRNPQRGVAGIVTLDNAVRDDRRREGRESLCTADPAG